jgi:sigma-B regulation protein RsbU (phosphoserine phosphatase)
VEGRILGVLDIQSRTKRPFSDEEIKMAEMIAAQLAIATLETRNFTRQQEETYIRTVLLEVARHAARPGDPAQALHSVLQLTTLIAGTRWAVLLLSEEEGRRLRVGPTAGIRRAGQDSIQGFAFDLSEFGMQTNAQASETSRQIHLPGRLATILGSEQASRFVLSDGETTLGLLLTEASSADAEHSSLLAGIAHQVSLRLQNVRLMQEASRRQALENEIAMARDIQSSFLPRIVPHHQGWQIGISWASAREVGGDFYDFIRLDPGQSGSRWGIAVGDVSGKSVPAALFMAVTRTLLRSIAPSHVDPGLALRRVNSMLQLESLSDYFVSIFYAVWEPETGSILCANGGHNPPLLIAPDGTSQWLSEHGMVLGVKENVSYATRRCEFSDGSLLILYTDGVTEASAPDEEFFGTERLRSLCESLHEQDAQTIVDSVSRAVHEFSAVDALSDDLTVLALKRVARDSEPQVELNPPGGER